MIASYNLIKRRYGDIKPRLKNQSFQGYVPLRLATPGFTKSIKGLDPTVVFFNQA